MSIKLMAAVWDDSCPVKGGELVLLLAAADYANDDGYLWPAQTTLARKSRLSREYVNRTWRRWEALGIVERAAEGSRAISGGTQVYRLRVDRLDRLAPNGCDSGSQAPEGPVIDDHRGCDPGSQGGVTQDHTEPSREPSSNRQGAEAPAAKEEITRGWWQSQPRAFGVNKNAIAHSLTKDFYELHRSETAQPFPAVLGVVKNALSNRIPPAEVWEAMERAHYDGKAISGGTLTHALGEVRRRRQAASAAGQGVAW